MGVVRRRERRMLVMVSGVVGSSWDSETSTFYAWRDFEKLYS